MNTSFNINRGIHDPFYRYKMPRILAKVEGKGNGIKTVIANMSDIAKALARPPTCKFVWKVGKMQILDPTKYFGCELGAQTNFDLKNDRYIVNGEHDANKLQEILDGFIKKFVLCPACDNPETTLVSILTFSLGEVEGWGGPGNKFIFHLYFFNLLLLWGSSVRFFAHVFRCCQSSAKVYSKDLALNFLRKNVKIKRKINF